MRIYSIKSTLYTLLLICNNLSNILGDSIINFDFIITLLSSYNLIFVFLGGGILNNYSIKLPILPTMEVGGRLPEEGYIIKFLSEKIGKSEEYIRSNINLNVANMKSLFTIFDLNHIYYNVPQPRRPFLYTYCFTGGGYYIVPETHIKFTRALKGDKVDLFSHFGRFSIGDIKNAIILNCFEDSVYLYDRKSGSLYKYCGYREILKSNDIVYIHNGRRYIPYDPTVRMYGNRDLYIKNTQGVLYKLLEYKSGANSLGTTRSGSHKDLVFIKYRYVNSRFTFVPCTLPSLHNYFGFVEAALESSAERHNRFLSLAS